MSLTPYINKQGRPTVNQNGTATLMTQQLYESLCCKTQCLITFEAVGTCENATWSNKEWKYVSHIKYTVPLCEDYIEPPGTFTLVSGEIVCGDYFAIGSFIEVWGPVM